MIVYSTHSLESTVQIQKSHKLCCSLIKVSDFQAAFMDSSNFVKNAITVGSVKVLYK